MEMDANQQTFKWPINCNELAQRIRYICNSNVFEFVDGSKLKLKMEFSRLPSIGEPHTWKLHVVPVELKDDCLLGVNVKLWLEDSEHKKLADFYSGIMIFKSVGQSSGEISTFTCGEFKNLLNGSCSDGIVTFCCEVQLKGKLTGSKISNNDSVILKVDDKEFKISRDVLANQSEVFNQKTVVQIDDVSVKAMEILTEWPYFGKSDELPSVAEELLIFAHKYKFPKLKIECIKAIQVDLSTDNICSILILAFKCNEEELKKLALDFITCKSDSDCLQSLLESREWIKLTAEKNQLANEILMAIVNVNKE